MMQNIFSKYQKSLPDNFWRFLIIGFIIYSFFIVGKVIADNYQQNKKIDKQKEVVQQLKEEIRDIELNIAYYKTDTYKEKVGRAKLRYVLPGESVVALPYDEKNSDQNKKNSFEVKVIERSNLEYWKMYFFGE